ncbi:innexin inx2-like [Panulirus ornatus]|uniref:innexin inx2-like n=1 Tax=Panulirus ornatus TaxID=150431 RepID=UPI003A855260
MPGGQDIRNIFSTILNTVKSRANKICAASCDGLVLRMHYRWTFFILLGGFLTTWYSWYHRDVIVCVSHFNAETQVRLDYINICLTYPYVEDDDQGRRYLLFYRWISWSFLVLAGAYYIPRKLSKNFENKKCKSLLEDLASNAHHYDQTEVKLVERAARYMFFNLRTHDGIYMKYLFVNIVALLVDNFAMLYFDFILQGRFLRYGFESYPFDRDPENFSDYMSQTFPPFVLCELTPGNQLVNRRTERLGCHLTIMELYEKVFLVLWVWLIVLHFLTCCYIVFLLLLWLPWVRVVLLRTSKPAHALEKVRQINVGVIRNCKVGDIYLLYRIKSHISHVRFYELLTRLSDPSLYTRAEKHRGPEAPPDTKEMPPSKNQVDIVRNQEASVALDTSIDPEYLYRLLSCPEILGRGSR